MTFSIVAADMDAPDGPEWGVAVASKFLAAGSVVPWARAGVGAIATQALANVTYGPVGLDRLSRGESVEEVLAALTGPDDDSEQRQLGLVDATGSPATFTGSDCLAWAGGRTGTGYCCQGNILAGPEVLDALASAFEGTSAPLAERLSGALAAGFDAGGDRRGMQSAALLVVREAGGYLGLNDRAVDLRIDDDPDAVSQLGRVLRLHRLYFPSPGSLEFVEIDEALASELRARLRTLGIDPGDGHEYDRRLGNALFGWVGAENLEERWTEKAEIEATVLEFLREASG